MTRRHAIEKAPGRPIIGQDQRVGDCKVAVVIVNYRTPELTERCLASLRAERAHIPALRAVVVDGGSADGSAERLSQFVVGPEYADWASFLPLNMNGGYGWANNQAILTLARQDSPPDFIHILNPDAEVHDGAVASLARELLANPRCGAAGSQLIGLEGAPAASAFRFPSPGQEFASAAQSEKLRRLLRISPTVLQPSGSADVDWVTGASVMFSTEALRQAGLFDDGFFLYFEEVELMHRLRAEGWRTRHVPDSRVFHAEGASTGVGAKDRPLPDYWYRSRRRYYVLSSGAAAAISANLASIAGRTLAILKRPFGRPRTSIGFRTSDLLRLGFWPTSTDAKRSAPAWADEPGKAPAWMTHQ